ncbi:hypothetical protein BJ166DRAFT_592576 [Pestalotiopsis sp. NC0098]|nr:hypothetical protein BJ166DRAFT_592576 [Pestalotiopsis sp. NC0098]
MATSASAAATILEGEILRPRTPFNPPVTDGELREWIATRINEQYHEEFFAYFRSSEGSVVDNMFDWSESWHQARLRVMLFFLRDHPEHYKWLDTKARKEAIKVSNSAVHVPSIAQDCLVNESKQWDLLIDPESMFEKMYGMPVQQARRIRDMAFSRDEKIPEDIRAIFKWSMKFIDRFLDWKQIIVHDANHIDRQRKRPLSVYMAERKREMEPFDTLYSAFLRRLGSMLDEAEVAPVDPATTVAIAPDTFDTFEEAAGGLIRAVRESGPLEPSGIVGLDEPRKAVWPAFYPSTRDFKGMPTRPKSACRPKRKKIDGSASGSGCGGSDDFTVVESKKKKKKN